MKTIIYQDAEGNPVLSITGDLTPEDVARKYLELQKILHPEKEIKEEAKNVG